MKTVTLTTPIQARDTILEKLEFRDPVYSDFVAIGDPRMEVLRGDKLARMPIQESVKAYINRLLTGVETNVLAGASLMDTIAIQNAIISFFREAEAKEDEEPRQPGIVILSNPLRGHKGSIDCLRFREPVFEDFLMLSDPRVFIYVGTLSEIKDGELVETPIHIPKPVPDIVRLYAERLLIQGGGADINIMARASLRDTLRIQQAILGFFEAVDVAMTSSASPETSRS